MPPHTILHTHQAIVPVINGIRDAFDLTVISLDWHPHHHCSFVETANAGQIAGYNVRLGPSLNVGPNPDDPMAPPPSAPKGTPALV